MKANTILPKLTIDKLGCQLHVISAGQVLPVEFTSLVSHEGCAPEIIRIAGGCEGLSTEIQDGMLGYFLDAFKVVDETGATTREFRGTAFSGGTANADDEGGIKSDMITNVPAHLAQAYPCIAMSTTPRTGVMHMDGRHGGVIVDAYGGRLDYRQHAAAVVQQDPANVLDWDGDLELYLTLLEGWKLVGKRVGIIVMNGGKVTRDEIYKALKRGIPVFVIEGSLREADAFIKAFNTGDFSDTAAEEKAALVKKGKLSAADIDAAIGAIRDQCKQDLEGIDRSLVSIVKVNDAKALREALLARGFLA
jgi:hypothetical protein